MTEKALTLLDLYERASRDQRRRGRRWYPEARRRLRQFAHAYGLSYAQVAAVFAIVSPDMQLRSCFDVTEAILRGERKAGRYPTMQRPRIEGALASRYPGRFARGPKVSAFYRALMGDTEAVVIDRWSARAAGWQSGHHAIPITVQRELVEAYRAAAEEAQERVREFQAITWLTLRETTPVRRNGREFVPRLSDITHERREES